MIIENELIRNFWHLIGHTSEVSSNGDYLCLSLSNIDLVVYNDFGNLIAFDNKCPHRGTKFFDNGFGNARLTCPYHGWTYTKGRMYVSNRKEFSLDEEPKLNTFKITSLGGFLFVSMEPNNTLQEQLKGLGGLIEKIGLQISSRCDENSYHYDTYWPIAIENALEPYHVADVHPSTLGKLNLSNGENQLFNWGSIWRSEIQDIKINKNLKRLSKYFDAQYQYQGYEFIYIFPFSMLSNTFGFSYSLQNFFPTSSKKHTAFSSRLYTAKLIDEKASDILAGFFDSTSKINRQIFLEDHSICKRVDIAEWSSKPLKYSAKSEEKIQHFRKIIRYLEG